MGGAGVERGEGVRDAANTDLGVDSVGAHPTADRGDDDGTVVGGRSVRGIYIKYEHYSRLEPPTGTNSPLFVLVRGSNQEKRSPDSLSLSTRVVLIGPFHLLIKE